MLDSEVLLGHVLGWSRTKLHTYLYDPVPMSAREEYLRLLERRAQGVPVAYLTGWKEFYSRRFWVRPGTLVPRPETESLVDCALRLLAHSPGPGQVLDLCCGTGCIGITLVLESLLSRVVCSDIDPEAIAQTRENAEFYKVRERLEVVESDLFEGVSGRKFDLIASNPPYVGRKFGPRPEPWVEEHEPSLALFSGDDGLQLIERLVEEAPRYLVAGGSLLLECAPFQTERIEAWMVQRGFTQTSLWHDLSGLPRGVSGRWEGQLPDERN